MLSEMMVPAALSASVVSDWRFNASWQAAFCRGPHQWLAAPAACPRSGHEPPSEAVGATRTKGTIEVSFDSACTGIQHPHSLSVQLQ